MRKGLWENLKDVIDLRQDTDFNTLFNGHRAPKIEKLLKQVDVLPSKNHALCKLNHCVSLLLFNVL